jgi:VanZ family protein
MIKGRFKGFLPSLIWTIVIVILSILPGETVKSATFLDFWNVDKLGHLIVYLLHSYLLLLGFRLALDKKVDKQQILISMLLGIGLGILLELIQYFFTQDRTFDLLDMLANAVGTILGMMLFKRMHK